MPGRPSVWNINRLIKTKKQANIRENLLFLAKGPGKRKPSRNLRAALSSLLISSYNGRPFPPIMVVSVEPRKVNIIQQKWWPDIPAVVASVDAK